MLRLMTCVCVPMALLLLVYNMTSYSSLVATSSGRTIVSSAAERRRAAQVSAAQRAMAQSSKQFSAHLTAAAAVEMPQDLALDPADASDPGAAAGDAAEPPEAAAAAAAEASVPTPPSPPTAVSLVVNSVVNSAIGTANAAAAVVGNVASSLAAAAGNGACKPATPDWDQRPLNYIVPVESKEWPVGCEVGAVLAGGGAALCRELARVARHREVVLTVVDSQTSMATLRAFLGAAPRQVLVAVRGGAGLEAAAAVVRGTAGAGLLPLPDDSPLAALPAVAFKYAVVRAVLAAGCGVLYADVGTSWRDGGGALGYLARDADVEVVSSAGGGFGGSFGLAHGRVVSVDDAQMGWSRYAQSLAISALSPTLFYASATAEAAAMMGGLEQLFSRGAAPPADEAYLFTREAIGPAYDGKRIAGVTVRVLGSSCFGVGQGSVAGAAPSVTSGGDGASSAASFGRTNDILSSRRFEARHQVLTKGCAKAPPEEGSPAARPLNYVVRPSEAWPPRETCEKLELSGLCDVVSRVAIGREVLAAVSNKNIFHMLTLFVNGIKAANVSNAMVVALDDATDAWLAERQVARYKKVLVSRTGSTDNHATSGLKFKILVDFLSIGCSVLLSDVDVIWLQNPFPFLYRDTDVEGMTDGWDHPTSYGYDYGSGALRVFARNSGMFYLQATHDSNRMMKRLARRMEREGTWDQTAYNEEQFYPAHGSHATVGVTSRVMNYLCNLNSKTFFRFVREDAELLAGYRPVSVHVKCVAARRAQLGPPRG